MAEEYDNDQGDGHDNVAGSDDLRESSFNPVALGLKEIINLAHVGVSSHKPGNGVAELLSDDTNQFWQSDGPQPHQITIHFSRRVEIRAIRFYVDHTQDESYTPTNIVFSAGTAHHDLKPFVEMPLSNPIGWQDVPLAGIGGGHDANSLSCWIIQILVKENHQNGKDTHMRGVKIYALEDTGAGGTSSPIIEDPQPMIIDEQAGIVTTTTTATVPTPAVMPSIEDVSMSEIVPATSNHTPKSTAEPSADFERSWSDDFREPEIR
ncbi:anaphase-promoting complex, subunit 10-domain-containing protein [Podospora fimiseda]|uniref:Anaphase-promoting complex, subunit 10-domain-containing protein n=1 Tax=Podospora fimiseda TaxID=252190 RepID=A0AAN6YPI7_9PEZI|nr:anaphase-promoting complex, subunit 10-domain-containing protein [Podospora fimiseda]